MVDKNPTQYASGYTLDLYCDHYYENHDQDSLAHTFYGETFSEAAKEAKAKGWKIHKNTRTATCPKCSKKGV